MINLIKMGVSCYPTSVAYKLFFKMGKSFDSFDSIENAWATTGGAGRFDPFISLVRRK
jgi:hypothetical protein